MSPEKVWKITLRPFHVFHNAFFASTMDGDEEGPCVLPVIDLDAVSISDGEEEAPIEVMFDTDVQELPELVKMFFLGVPLIVSRIVALVMPTIQATRLSDTFNSMFTVDICITAALFVAGDGDIRRLGDVCGSSKHLPWMQTVWTVDMWI